jgi:WD40 repeat protein
MKHRLFMLSALLAALLTLLPAAAQDSAPPVPAQILVWTANGVAPGQHAADDPGQIALIDAEGVAEPILPLPEQVSRVETCGDEAASPDGSLLAFYVGLDEGTLYVMRGSGEPTALATVQSLTCLGLGTFQFAPDASRLGYIAYESDASVSEFADGILNIHAADDLSEEFSYENVTSFDLTSSGAAFISFFTDDRNIADEAAVFWWDGAQAMEVATLTPIADDCRFTSAEVAATINNQILAVMGHRCTSGDTATNWQLYLIDPAQRSATLAASNPQVGAFASFARSNAIMLSPDGARAYFTTPDGLTAYTTGLRLVDLNDLTVLEVLPSGLVMPNASGTDNAAVQVSPDGRWLAGVITNAQNENTLSIWNLSDPGLAPIAVAAGSTGDLVSSMRFLPDSSRLLAVIGGSEGANNSLITVDLSTGSNSRIARGRFGPGLTLSADGTQAALLDWQLPGEDIQELYANLVRVDVANGAITTLYVGADIVDNKAENERFAFPLGWR